MSSFKSVATQMVPDTIRGLQSKPKNAWKWGRVFVGRVGVTEVGQRTQRIDGRGWAEMHYRLA